MTHARQWFGGLVLVVLCASAASAQTNPSTSFSIGGAPQTGYLIAFGTTYLGCQASCIGEIDVSTTFTNVTLDYCHEGTYVNYACWDHEGAPWPGFPSRAESAARFNNPLWGCYSGRSTHWVTWPGQAPNQFDVRTHTACFTQPPNCTNNSCLPNSPIVIRFHGAPADVKFSKPDTPFDIDADGVVEIVSWPIGSVAFLVLDRNENGLIDNGSELFGDKTVAGAPEGFSALKALGDTGDSPVIDATFPLWAKLKLWWDRNRDGVSQPEELRPVSDILVSISMMYALTPDEDKYGNAYRYKGFARYRSDGQLHPIYDVFLAEKP